MVAVFTVKLGTRGLTSTALVEKGRNVAASLKLNPVYPTLQALLPGLETACDTLDLANQEVVYNGGKVAHEKKRLAEVALRTMLKEFGGYVQAISGGDRAKILSAAFDVAKQRTPLPAPKAPENLKVSRTVLAGSLKVRWNRVHGGILYYLEMQLEGGAEWERVLTTTKTNHEMAGLATGKSYSFRVQAVASSGISPMSEIVTNKAA